MIKYIARRMISLVVILILVPTTLFLLLRLSGDPAALFAGPDASPEQISSLREALGYNNPLHVQYVRFMNGLLFLDFGNSLRFRAPAFPIALERLPATLILTGAAMAIAVSVGIPVGILVARRRRGVISLIAQVMVLLGQSTPAFWLGILLMMVFSVKFGLLPVVGHGDVRHLILPAFTLAAWPMAGLTRLVRSGMLDVLGQDYIRTAYAKGLSDLVVTYRHAFRNVMISVVTYAGLQFSQLLGGAVIVETVFAWPGMGSRMVLAVLQRDYPLVQASVFIIAVLVVLIMLLVDLMYNLVDPRTKQW